MNPDIPESIPLYLRECQNCNAELNKPNAEGNHEQKVPLVGEDRVVFLTFTAKVCLISGYYRFVLNSFPCIENSYADNLILALHT